MRHTLNPPLSWCSPRAQQLCRRRTSPITPPITSPITSHAFGAYHDACCILQAQHDMYSCSYRLAFMSSRCKTQTAACLAPHHDICGYPTACMHAVMLRLHCLRLDHLCAPVCLMGLAQGGQPGDPTCEAEARVLERAYAWAAYLDT